MGRMKTVAATIVIGAWMLSGGSHVAAEGKILFSPQVRSATPKIIAPVSLATSGELLTTGFFAQLYVTSFGGPSQRFLMDPFCPSVMRPGHIFPGEEAAPGAC